MYNLWQRGVLSVKFKPEVGYLIMIWFLLAA